MADESPPRSRYLCRFEAVLEARTPKEAAYEFRCMMHNSDPGVGIVVLDPQTNQEYRFNMSYIPQAVQTKGGSP